MKKVIIGIIIGTVMTTTIVVGATYLYHANEVSYNNTDVESAINDLYGLINTNKIKAFVITAYDHSGAHGINTNGSYWNDSPDSWGYMKEITHSDIISATRASYGVNTYQCTVLKTGYYLVGSWDIVHYQAGDTFSLLSGASGGGIGVVLYFGEINPFSN